MYTTTTAAFRTAGITISEISAADMKEFVLDAEAQIDRLTNTTYWSIEESGTATSAATATLTCTGAFTGDVYANETVWVYSGKGSGQARKILSHTNDTLTVDRNWTTIPDNTSLFRIIHCGSDPFMSSEKYDCDNTRELFTTKYPIQILETAEIDSVSITPSYIYQYKEQGKLKLGTSAEASYWTSKDAQLNILSYWYGVYPLPREVTQLCNMYAALKALAAQMGGTFDTPSTYSLPEGSVTIGQAYINIRGTFDVLLKNATMLEERLIRYFSVV
jgi:hypothetical protein